MISDAVTSPLDIVGVARLFDEIYVMTTGGLYRLSGAEYENPAAGTLVSCYDHSGADTPSAFGAAGGALYYGTKSDDPGVANFRIIRLDRDDAADPNSFTATVEHTDALALADMSGCVGFAVFAGLPAFLAQYDPGGNRMSKIYIRQNDATWDAVFVSNQANEYPDTDRRLLAADGDIAALWTQSALAAGEGFHLVSFDGYYRPLVIALDDGQVAAGDEGIYFCGERTSDNKHIFGILPRQRLTGGVPLSTDEYTETLDMNFKSFIGLTVDDAEILLGCQYGRRFYFGLRINYDPGSGSVDTYALLSIREGDYREETAFDTSGPFLKPWAVVPVGNRDWLAMLDDNDPKKLYFLLDSPQSGYSEANHYSYRG